MANIKDMLANMDTKQKATVGVFIVIVGVIVWQVMGMFGGGAPAPDAAAQAAAAAPPMPTPKPAPVATAEPAQQVSQDDAEMFRVQKETQARYIAAITELQMLKVAQEMVDVNAKIMKSKEDTVTSQKKIVDMLTGPTDASGAPISSVQTADGQPQTAQSGTQAASTLPKDVSYTVVSVSQLQGRWGAVLSYASNLYSVHTGDVLPADSSTVVSIDKSGVVIEKDGVKTKISMVSVI